MRIKKSDKTGIRIFMLLMQFFILISCFIYLDYFYITNLRPDKLAELKFVETKCFVMTKKLATKGKYFRRYRADFLISYQANGVQYNRWVSGNGLDMSYIRDSASQEQVLSDYADGKNYRCWYNPGNPEEALLVPRKKWTVTLPFILPVVMGVLSLLLFLKNIIFIIRHPKDKK